MVQIRQIKVGQILTHVIANRQTVCGINDFIQQLQQPRILNLTPYNGFQHIMLYGRIELADVRFKAIARAFSILHETLHALACLADAAALDT